MKMTKIELKPFSSSREPTQVFAALELAGDLLRLNFELRDVEQLVEDSWNVGTAKTWPRGDNLWKATCFECFLAVPGDDGYWEVNLSPTSQKWALYRFDSYRSPQPPRPSTDFDLQNISVTSATLSCELKLLHPAEKFEAALAAVVRTSLGVSYFSVKHRPDKADFHWRDGFVLKV